MTMIRARLARGRSVNVGDFADITTTKVQSVEWGQSGYLEVTFASTLTTDEWQRVMVRLISSDATEETALLQARAAHAANTTYLDKTGKTTAEALAQVDALTRQVNHLIRYIARL